MPLQPGDPAPKISAPNQRGDSVSPSFEEPTVVYFYVEDGTPGCQTQAQQFTMEAETYRDAGVTVYGVSTDDVDSHAAFAEAEGVEFDLLADPNGEVCAAFDVPLDDQGRATRTTFVVDDGTVIATYEGVRAEGHARDVLMDLLDEGVAEL